MNAGRPAGPLLLAAVLATAAAGCLPERDFMPLAVGNRWDYRIFHDDGRTRDIRLEITGRESKLTWWARDGDLECLWSKEDEIISVQQAGSRIYLLWLPPAPGSGWWTVTPDGERVWCKVVGRETVHLPAGTFRNCAVVVMEQPGGKAEMRHWFAPDVGWVCYSWGPPGGRPWLVRRLVGWELKPPEKYVPKEKTAEPPAEAHERR